MPGRVTLRERGRLGPSARASAPGGSVGTAAEAFGRSRRRRGGRTYTSGFTRRAPEGVSVMGARGAALLLAPPRWAARGIGGGTGRAGGAAARASSDRISAV